MNTNQTVRDTGQKNLLSKDSANATSTKRMSVSLSGDAARLLEHLAEAQGITQNEALRKAIATEAYLRQEMEQGAKVLLQKSNKEIREVVFR
jgi:Ribbon-helix-helix protein, copG family